MMTLKPTKSEQIESLTRDLAEAHKALNAVVAILRGIDLQGEQISYEIGRAQGTASLGLTMSGDYRRGDAK